jgi:hypothetical protein
MTMGADLSPLPMKVAARDMVDAPLAVTFHSFVRGGIHRGRRMR